MSRNRDYQHLLNSKTWKAVRAAKLRAKPLCEECAKRGIVSAAVDVHHVIPCETATSMREMKRLAFDWHNLRSLCIPCHVRIHKEAKSHTKESHHQRSNEALQRWIDRHNNINGSQDTLRKTSVDTTSED